MNAMDDRLSRVRLIAIGASAGGVEALTGLLRWVPKNFPATIVVVLHLAPDRRSLLAGILQPVCKLPVSEAEDKEPVVPGRVYTAPPGYHLLVDAGPPHFELSVDDPVNFSRPSIDVLFESCAESYGSALLGIVLSGASDDGARGLQAIKRAGGITAVQDPAEAKVPAMPRAALAACAIDFNLGLAQFELLFQRIATPASAARAGGVVA